MRIPNRRSPVTVLLLTLFTFGIYYFYWVYVTSRDIDEFLGESDIPPIVHVLLFLVTGTLYGFFWDFLIGRKTVKMQQRVGLPEKDHTLLNIVLDLLGAGPIAGLGIIVPLIQQSDLNAVYDRASQVSYR
jgi:uncharacterized integral membrane protein